MRILYCAIDQAVPGTTGGSVHVQAVAAGLARRGHDVHVLAAPGARPFPTDGARWIAMAPPLGARQLRWTRRRAVSRLVAALRPDVVMERYYNFGGEGITAARAAGIVGVLEVNAPVIDHPGSRKAVLDRVLLVEPMRRWREHLCKAADVIVTPSSAIVPSNGRGKIVEVEWGADTGRFRPGVGGKVRFARPAGLLAVFAGAFRSWHGAVHLVRAMRRLAERGQKDVSAVLIGDGPELARARDEARGLDSVAFSGALPHEEMPAQLAAADVGVAPFDVEAHAPLALGFYWSPLKIFEYMASGLPVVAPRVQRIPSLVRDGGEGLLYDAPADEGIADALLRLRDPDLRARLGRAARERAVHEYSWDAHCRALEEAMAAAVARGAGA